MIHFTKYKTSNGLTVIHHQDNASKLVCINILYDVGARDEDANKTGFAHLFEHLMFGGSINIQNYDEPLERAGGENNAFTNNDITNYYLTIPSNNVETGFWLESDRMLSLAFSEKSLEVQRSVVIEEFKQRYLNQPYGDVWLLLKPLAYKVHPYLWNTIGKEISHIENATIEDVKDFFFKHYLPSNAILSVTGNIELETTQHLVEKWFAPIPSPPKPQRNLPQEPKQTQRRELKVERDVPQDAIYMAYHICDRLHPDYPTMDLISDILSNGASSRLEQKLMKEKQIFSDIHAYLSGDRDPGLFIVSGKLLPEIDFKTAEENILEQLELLKNELVGERELQKSKNKVESLLAFTEVNIMNRALGLATYEWLGDANMINEEPKKYAQITAAQLQETAQKYLQTSNSSVLYYASKK